jgi:outer membrane protein assembly factor BamB
MTKLLPGAMTTKLAALTLTALTLTVAVLAQPGNYKVRTHPTLPSTEALDRMDLKLAWSARLTLRGDRDGIATVQVIEGPGNPQLLVQAFSGLTALFDGETGDLLWQLQVGRPFTSLQPAGHNFSSIFAVRRNTLYILNRATGLHRLYTVDRFTGVRENGMELPFIPSAEPVADKQVIYFVMGTRATAFRLPNYAADVFDKGDLLTEPEMLWTVPVSDQYVEFPPLVSRKQLTVATRPGDVISLNRLTRQLRGEYRLDGRIVARPGQHFANAYIGTAKGTLYAINMENAQLPWRFLPGGPILQQPAVLDRDVFVAADQVGLFRVDRETGQEIWGAKQIDRFLAANDRFVYALHHRGEMHILDYVRGGTLARYDLKEWMVPVLNELSDRIYLASHDGQIVCMRHRELITPLRYHVPEPEKTEETEEKEPKAKDDKEAMPKEEKEPKVEKEKAPKAKDEKEPKAKDEKAPKAKDQKEPKAKDDKGKDDKGKDDKGKDDKGKDDKGKDDKGKAKDDKGGASLLPALQPEALAAITAKSSPLDKALPPEGDVRRRFLP